MQTSQLHTIVLRLEKLEKQNRRFKRAGLCALVVAVAILLTGQAVPRNHTIEAQLFLIKDVNGKMRASLGMDTVADAPYLKLYDANEKSRVVIEAYPRQPNLWLSGADEKMRAVFATAADSTGLELFDTSGNIRANLQVDQNGTLFEMLDAEGRTLWSAPLGTSLPGPTTTASKPRVFIEAWSSGGAFKPEQKSQSFDELAAFGQGCPRVALTSDRQKAAYILRLEHHITGGQFLRPKNPPADYDVDFWRYALFDREGAQIVTETNPELGGAVDVACKVILRNWGK